MASSGRGVVPANHDNDDYRKLSNYDNHTLFVTNIGPIEGGQLNDALIEYFAACRKALKVSDPNYFGNWRINIVKNKLNKPIGVAYIFMQKEEAYNVIIGRNPNGTARVKEIPNPDYKEKEEENFDFSMLMKPSSMCWADMVDEEVPKTLVVKEDKPLSVFPDIVLTSEQANELLVKTVTPSILPCGIPDPEPQYDRYTLFGLNIPSFVTPQYLRALFLPYVTCKRSIEAGYPQVTIIGRKAYVKFQSYNNDSLFALIMLKKIILKDKNGVESVIFFTYARDNRKV